MNNDRTASAADFVNDLGSAIRANPLPSALIGMGLVWLFTGGKSAVNVGLAGVADGAAHLRSRGAEIARDLGGSIGDTVTFAHEGMRQGGAAAAQKASDVAFSLRDSAQTIDRQFFSTARASAADLLQRQPLLLGAIGVALGAAVAASLHPTAAETDLLGDTSTNFQDGVRKFAEAASRQAAFVADGVITTVAQEARVHGLTSDALEQSARESGRKVERVVGRVADGLQSRIS